MNDPHVNWIKYRLIQRENTSFDECPTLHYECDDYSVTLQDNILTCNFKAHFESLNQARSHIEPFLRSWEVDAGIQYKQADFRFKYMDYDIIDRSPVPGAVNITALSLSAQCSVRAAIEYHVGRATYPAPPNNFSVSPEVETLWQRFNLYRQGKEPIQGMAYFCSTRFVETAAIGGGNQRDAVKVYKIDLEVLRKLNELSSTRGDTETARKGNAKNMLTLTGKEKMWIEECILLLIRRLGEYASDPSNLKQITMSDLPSLV